MASIKRRPDGRWRARYRDPSGRERAQHFDRKVDAQTWLDGKRGEPVRGEYIDPDAGRQTFKSYAETWRAAQVHRRRHPHNLRRTFGGTSTRRSVIAP